MAFGLFRSSTWFKLCEVPVRVHHSMLIFIPVLFIGSDPGWWPLLALLIPIALVSTVLHELGHAIVGRHRGHPADHITLTPLGGFTRMPGRLSPADELQFTLGGPMVTLVLAVGAGAVWAAAHAAGIAVLARAAGWAAAANTLYLVVNLLPIYPMDGGRILKNLLIPRKGRVETMRLMAATGRGMGITLGMLAVIRLNPFLILLALLFWLSTEAEYRWVQQREKFEDAADEVSHNSRLREGEFSVGPPPYAAKDHAGGWADCLESFHALVLGFKKIRLELP